MVDRQSASRNDRDGQIASGLLSDVSTSEHRPTDYIMACLYERNRSNRAKREGEPPNEYIRSAGPQLQQPAIWSERVRISAGTGLLQLEWNMQGEREELWYDRSIYATRGRRTRGRLHQEDPDDAAGCTQLERSKESG